jgi:hypothetical protein
MISLNAIVTKPLFEAKYGLHSITVTAIEKEHSGNEVIGKMIAWIQLAEIEKQQIENDMAASYAITELFKAANKQPKRAAEVFDTEYLRQWEKTYISLGNGVYVCEIEYAGDLPCDEEPTPAPGTRAYEIEYGIPERTA